MAISDEKLAALIGKPAADALLSAGYTVTSEPERLAWKTVQEKYEFLLSALDMIARKPLREPETDADELRYLVEHTLKMVGIVNGVTPFDQLRFTLGRHKEWGREVVRILRMILDSGNVDSEVASAIRSAIDKGIELINSNL